MTYMLFYFITHRLLKSFTRYMVKKSTNFIPHPIGSIYDFQAREVVPWGSNLFLFSASGLIFLYISIISAVFYISTELAGCLVDL
jgi:hypothetical protein